jgi:hypothetical protein
VKLDYAGTFSIAQIPAIEWHLSGPPPGTVPEALMQDRWSICVHRYRGACRPSAFSTSTSGVVTPLVLVTTPKLV